MANANMNYSYSAGVSPTLQDYFQRRALKNVQPNLGYGTDAQMIEQPMNNGKHVNFHRFTELPAIPDPLIEGVTPDGQTLTETAFSVMTKPYGGYMAYTDEFDLNHIDNLTQAMSDRLNNQARLTIDTVIRDALCAGLNVMYPGTCTSRADLAATDKLDYAVIKKAVRDLKKKGAQVFSDGFFHAKIDHDTYYDISADKMWIDVAVYQDKSKIEKYELGTIYRVKFFEVDNGKVFKAESYIGGGIAALTIASYDADTRTAVVSEAVTVDQARAITGKLVDVTYDDSGTDVVTPMCIERVFPGSAGTVKIVFRWDPTTDNFTPATEWASGAGEIGPSGVGATVTEVHASLIYGTDAFGIVKLGSAGKPNIQTIIHEPGSSGSEDPLNQRGTIAWKVKHFCAAILQDDFIVRVEHAVSA